MTVRTSLRGDGSALRALMPMALHGDPGHPNLKLLPGAVDEADGYPDRHTIGLRHRSGKEVTAPALCSLRIADHYGDPAGMSYSGPPMYWITKKSGLPMRPTAALCGRLMELQMLAVLPRHRRQGHGGDLLHDVIQRHRAAGYTALMVVVEDAADPRLMPWYVKHGFVFAPRGRHFKIKFWSIYSIYAEYNHIDTSQYLGMLPLADTVTITPSTITNGHMPTITGLLD